jgi:Na+-translocating ferredoxin:NAD+ oxidoreductase subunit C
MSYDFSHLHRFPGGLRLASHKDLSTTRPIAHLPLPRRLTLPLSQHIGLPAVPLVEAGERVYKGQMIAAAEGYISAPVHASSSGTVVAIAELPIPHPSGLSAPCIVIETDGKDEWLPTLAGVDDVLQRDPVELRNLIRNAGIVGLGGAGFPASVKLNTGLERRIDLLVLNGAECEPYISCDDLLMRERAADIIAGLRILRHVLNAAQCVIGVEDNKPEAMEALRAALAQGPDEGIQVVAVPTRYPAGGEKQLIQVLTGLEVPSQGLPADLGILCHNVGTAAAVYQALTRGHPLVSRIVTVSGDGVTEPCNVEVPIGTPIAELIAFCGGYTRDVRRLLMGGPMMGIALHSDQLPVIKTCNCILAATDATLAPAQPQLPCIRCSECAVACPANLLPQQLYWHAHARDLDAVQEYDLFDCIECGCCAQVCPSHIPLVQYFRYAKTEIWDQEREREKADLARLRHEFRLERLEREKREKAERHKQKRKALDTPAGDDDPRKAAIAAALERVKARKSVADEVPRNTDNLTPEQQRQIEEANRRRAAARNHKADTDNGAQD